METNSITELIAGERLPDILSALVLLAFFFLLVTATYYLIQIGNRQLPESKQVVIGSEQIKLSLFVLLGFTILYWAVVSRTLLLSVLTPFIVAGAIAYALNPVISYAMHQGLSRLQATAALFICILLSIVFVSLTLIPLLAEEIRALGEQLPHYTMQWYRNFESWYNRYQNSFTFLPDSLDDLVAFFGLEFQTIRNWLAQSAGTLIKGISSVMSSLVTLVMIPVLTFYFMKDASLIGEAAHRMIPPGSRQWVLPLASRIDEVLGGFIRGQLIVAAFVGVMSGLAMLILGIDFAILIGLIAGITNIIPYLGPFIGAIPAVLMALLTSPLKTIWVILAFVVIQQVESSVVTPRIVGKRVGLHPAFVLLALLLGGSLGGLVGLLIAVPTAAVIRVLVMTSIQWFQKRYPSFFEPKKEG